MEPFLIAPKPYHIPSLFLGVPATSNIPSDNLLEYENMNLFIHVVYSMKFQGFQLEDKKNNIPCARAVTLNFKVFVFPFIFQNMNLFIHVVYSMKFQGFQLEDKKTIIFHVQGR